MFTGSASEMVPENHRDTIYNISLPAEVFENIVDQTAGVVFSFFSTSVLFPLRINLTDVVLENDTYQTIGSSVISATVANYTVVDLTNPIEIVMEITTNVCVSP